MSHAADNESSLDNELTESEDGNANAEAAAPALAATARAPRWRSIEQYWEARRLREHLKDYLVDEG